MPLTVNSKGEANYDGKNTGKYDGAGFVVDYNCIHLTFRDQAKGLYSPDLW